DDPAGGHGVPRLLHARLSDAGAPEAGEAPLRAGARVSRRVQGDGKSRAPLPRLEDVDLVIGVGVGLGWPVLFALLVWLDTDPLAVSARRRDWPAQLDPSPDRELSLVSEERWSVPEAETLRLRGERWWSSRFRGGVPLLVTEDAGLFGSYWHAYEVDGL